ncbi:MAG TPA: L,D-transpeptidase [Burkholderiales bacterium]|nr:L,D-transpeptidase [Burkholderiales bacterium]
MQTRLSITRFAVTAAAIALLCSGAAAAAASGTAGAAPAAAKRADFRGETISRETRHIADWAVHSGDNGRLPFIIVDKVNAKAFAFDAKGRLLKTTPVLLGMGIGDTFAPGVTSMDMGQTQPWQRITPAGRYLAEEGRDLKGQSVLWVDYDNAIAIHRMPTKNTAQRRPERMKSDNPADHRITYGCINVPGAFYDQVVRKHFIRKGGIVYVLPDTAPLKSVFRSYDIHDAPAAGPVRQTARRAETRKF